MVPQHAFAHAVLGIVQIVTKRAEQGIAECERALALDRNLAHAHAFIGVGKMYLGRSAETEGHIHEALRLSPRDRLAHLWMMSVGAAKLRLGEDAEALTWCRRGLEMNRNHSLAHFQQAAALALLGRLNEAQAATQAGSRSIRASPFADCAPIDPAMTRSTLREANASTRVCAWPGCRRGDVRNIKGDLPSCRSRSWKASSKMVRKRAETAATIMSRRILGPKKRTSIGARAAS